jgi:hypothetical protein
MYGELTNERYIILENMLCEDPMPIQPEYTARAYEALLVGTIIMGVKTQLGSL